MPEWLIITIALVVLLGVTGSLIGSLLVNIQRERRTNNVRQVWANFGLSISFCALFLISWAAQAVAEWGEFRADQIAHREPVTFSDFLVRFGQSTLENWQSEFLQLFSFVVLAALLIHRGSAESKDSDERMERKIDQIAQRLDELESMKTGR
jgi:hypothetical protein